MTRPGLYIFFLLSTLLTIAQVLPLSKSDSGVVLKSLEKYDYLLKQNDLRGASGALNDAAFVFWNNNHYQEAANYYEKSLVLNEKVANENGIAMINNNLGMLYADLGNYDKSLASFSKTLASRRANNEQIGIISALINMSVVLNNLKRYEESVEHLSEALDIARELYDLHQMRSVYGMLSETYEKMGNAEKSLYYFGYYKTFHEQIQRDEVKSISKELQKEKLEKELLAADQALKENELLKKELEIYKKDEELQEKDSINQSLYSNLSRKEAVIELLERDKKLQQMEAEAQAATNQKLTIEKANLRTTLIIVLLAVVIISTLIWTNARKTKRHRDELAIKNESIERQRSELEIANQTKDRIFSIISHDLRSPIRSLQGFFHYIDLFELPEELKTALSGMESELINSASLLENLLAWSKSQIDKHEPHVSEFEVKEIVDTTVRLLQQQAVKKGIELINHCQSEDTIISDPQMVQIAVRNLVQNAIKFTPEKGKVEVIYGNDERGTFLKVKDTGVGMTKGKLNSLFDIKTNESTEGTAREKGSGLGLILTKELVEQAGGKLSVTSEPGHGTEFSLYFSNVPKKQFA